MITTHKSSPLCPTGRGLPAGLVEQAVTSRCSRLAHKPFTPPRPLPYPRAVISHRGCSDPSSPRSLRVEEGTAVAVENGCHDNGAQLYPFALGEAVSRPPQAGPHHADEGQRLRARQLGVPAGNRHLPQLLQTHRGHMLTNWRGTIAALLHYLF